MALRMISHLNGDIEFVKRGPAPMVVPGYEPDEGDPYVFHPIMPACTARTFKKITSGCCPEGREVLFCIKYNLLAVMPSKCVDCAKKNQHQP
jgi:hypothetical protein